MRSVAAAALVVTSVLVTPAPARAAGWTDGPCTDGAGITVVVDFQNLGGGVNVRCVDGPVRSGLDALDQAGIAWEGTQRSPGFVCRIAGRPSPADEPCGATPPATAYWSYWIAPRGGQWCYSNLGAGNRTPPVGTLEGWSFALNRSAAQVPTPRFTPPPPPAGEAARPLAPSDCSAPGGTRPPTTSAPPAVPPPTSEPSAPPPAPEDTVATTLGEGEPETPTTRARPPGASPTTTPATTAASSGSTPPASTPTLPSTTSSIPAGTTSTTTSATTTTVLPAGSGPELGTVDLGDDGRGGSGLAAATVVAVVVLAGSGGGAAWWARRRRSGTT